jgi:hypothetical protein
MGLDAWPLLLPQCRRDPIAAREAAPDTAQFN